ncbi:MAG: HD domain-containing phosphohydrolase [Spirochaetaceae bacterium]
MAATEEATRHDLISGFRHETIEKAIRDARQTTVVASIFFVVFAALDYVLYPAQFQVLLLIRFAVVLLNMAVRAALSSGFGKRYVLELAMLEYLICGIAIATMVHLVGGYGSPYYAGINLVLLGFIVILPLDLTRTAIVCAIIYASYAVPILFLQEIDDYGILLNNHFFLLVTMALVLISAHLSRQIRFQEFSARFDLAEANEELKKLDVLKSQFFANISHEVRTPLTSIISPIQSLYQGEVGRLSKHQLELVEQMYRNSLRLLDMINQMLDFAKFDARKMELRLSDLRLDELAEQSVTMFSEVAARNGLDLTCEVEDEIPTVLLDRDKVERILFNLIRNAIKFTEEGSITVTVGCEEETLYLSVSDTGIGIPEEKLPVVFERFQQVDGSSTRRYAGTGLGLAIVKEAVELQKGKIWVESEPNEGTCFTVAFPTNLEELTPEAFVERRGRDRRKSDSPFSGPDRRRRPRRKADVPEISAEELLIMEQRSGVDPEDLEREAPLVEKEGYRVLYVEDNEDLRNYISRMLRSFGHTVTVAVDGADGWEKVQTAKPEIVVSDVMMPHVDGLELLQRIKGERATQRTPVILITAKSEIDSRITGLQTGADDYLPKPINLRELDARIRNLVTSGKLHEAAARAKELEKRIKQLTRSFAESLDLRDHYTAGHSRDVLAFGTLIAEELEIPVDHILQEALLLHDIGKIGIPDHILLKEGLLDEREWEVMKTHAELGAQLLRKFAHFEEVSEAVHAHQEHYDGTGYPRGLKGEEIPIQARIIAVADAWHAMTENRPYRGALATAVAVTELVKHKGSQFDPAVVDAFVRGMLRRGKLAPEELPAEAQEPRSIT